MIQLMCGDVWCNLSVSSFHHPVIFCCSLSSWWSRCCVCGTTGWRMEGWCGRPLPLWASFPVRPMLTTAARWNSGKIFTAWTSAVCSKEMPVALRMTALTHYVIKTHTGYSSCADITFISQQSAFTPSANSCLLRTKYAWELSLQFTAQSACNNTVKFWIN